MSEAPAAPRHFMDKKTGTMAVQANGERVGAYVKLTEWAAGDLPRFCDVDMRMAAWELGPVVTIGFMVRLAKDTLHTFHTWIDPGNPQGIRLLKNFSKKHDLVVYIVTDRVVRQIPTYNLVYRQALEYLRVLSRRAHAWDAERFDGVRGRVDRLYPTLGEMWRACGEGGLRSL